MNTGFHLGIAPFTYADLHTAEGLKRLYEVWLAEFREGDAGLYASYQRYRDLSTRGQFGKVEVSKLLCEVAPWVSRFIVRLFGKEVQAAADAIARQTARDLELFRFKDEFIKRRMMRRAVPVNVSHILEEGRILLDRYGCDALHNERAVSQVALHLLDQERALLSRPADDLALKQVRAEIDLLADLLLLHRDELQTKHGWLSLKFPANINYQNLVPLQKRTQAGLELLLGEDKKMRPRDGFDLTDPRMPFDEVMAEVDYCLYCHQRDKDSCSHGLREKSGDVKTNPLGIKLEGCPLDEKISEMNLMKRQGDPIAALALVCIDNPMCPGTGHRICNDCMKACIYQKQTPVNIPQIETGVLTDVLSMPFGVEIYGLLTRFNPLNVERPYPLPYNGKMILVVGLGPAGYTLAHHLSREGFGVIGIDGLKLEPLPEAYVGNVAEGKPPTPVKYYEHITKQLSERPILGFGGVSEYGITVRFDKNFLTLMYLTLSRNPHIKFYGGIRFGGGLTLEDAWQMGFDHVALAAGAGRPSLLSGKNMLCRGIRQASDFLMSLQLQGAYQKDSLANLQVRLPALVIGGGLTAIDTATELLAYYVVQAEKILERCEQLVGPIEGSISVKGPISAKWETMWRASLFAKFVDVLGKHLAQEEKEILWEQLQHGLAIRNEREQAKCEQRPPNFIPLLKLFGGVTIVYRKRLLDSPAYRLNPEEVEKSLEEGVQYLECLQPLQAEVDEYQALRSMKFVKQSFVEGHWVDGDHVEIPAKTVFVAIGTKPNTMYEREYSGSFELAKNGYFRPHNAEILSDGSVSLIPDPLGVFTSYHHQGKTVSFYGDNHPHYAGSVVKAMASAKHGFLQVASLLQKRERLHQQEGSPQPARGEGSADGNVTGKEASVSPQNKSHLHTDGKPSGEEVALPSFRKMQRRWDAEFTAKVIEVKRLTPTIVELVVSAPQAARKFQPGQFYRLQNFEAYAPSINGTKMLMEGLALTGAIANPEKGILSLIVLEMGASSQLCQFLKPGEPIVVMGPTGTPTEIPESETVCLVGGGLGNAVLFSIAKALKQNGCRILYFAGYRKSEDIYKQDEIEAYADQVIWACDVAPAREGSLRRRPQDLMFVGNLVQALEAYAEKKLGGEKFQLEEVDRMIVIGSDRMMAAVQQARKGSLRPYLKKQQKGVASINSPMLCMMKEICAQCLQKQVDPVTQQERYVFSCVNQDQPIEQVDFAHLSTRLRQNTLQEKLTNLWIQKLLEEKAR